MNEYKTPKSRKEYVCSQCGLSIPKGVKYVYHQWADVGTINNQKMHVECEREWSNLNTVNHVRDDEWFPLDDWDNEYGFSFYQHKKNIEKIYNL